MTLLLELLDQSLLPDQIKGEARQAIDALRAMGIEVLLATGDQERTARAIADEVGIAQPSTATTMQVRPSASSRWRNDSRLTGRETPHVEERMGIEVLLATGDQERTARAIADEVGIAHSDVQAGRSCERWRVVDAVSDLSVRSKGQRLEVPYIWERARGPACDR
jgi:magnesium-transporting ATPase (P-type)